MTISRPVTPPILLDQFLRYRSAAATVFWFIICATNAWGNTVTAQMDIARAHLSFADWEVASWEWSSSLVIFCLVPGIAWLDQRLPLAWGRLRSSIAGHVSGSVVFSLVHVVAMVAVRHAVYAMHGSHYDFGDPVSRFFYELIKDVRTYTLILVVVHLYHQLVLRAQGEASLLDAPDEGPALEPVERPTRFLVRKLGKVPGGRRRHRTGAGFGQLCEPSGARPGLSPAQHHWRPGDTAGPHPIPPRAPQQHRQSRSCGGNRTARWRRGPPAHERRRTRRLQSEVSASIKKKRCQ